MKLYLDLDGVFADFHGRVTNLCGEGYHENPQRFWQTIDKIPNFFYTLDPLPYAYDMFEKFRHIKNKEFLTACPGLTGKLVTAVEDKQSWVRDHLCPHTVVNVVPSWRHKAKYATPNSILVDDFDRNISAWTQAGGIGILHTDPVSTLKELEKYLDKLA